MRHAAGCIACSNAGSADRMGKWLCLMVLLPLLFACDDGLDTQAPTRARQVTAAEVAFVKTTLNNLQARSIAENREYCGYIGLTADGSLTATEARRGSRNTCVPRTAPKSMTVLASYHTHGATSETYVTELPSFEDMYQDIVGGVDGYIATPGGRVWYNDVRARRTNLLCGLNCVAADPSHRDREYLPVGVSFTVDEMRG